jgi:simple sugar transport system permease protein
MKPMVTDEAGEAEVTDIGMGPAPIVQRVMAAGSPVRVAIFIGTVVLALVVASPIIAIAGGNPLSAYGSLLKGSLGSQRGIAESMLSATPLLVGGLAVAVSFQAGLFNIGVEGQLVVGGLVAGAIGAEMNLPTGLHLLVAMLGAAVAGALWSLIPALLKAYRGVHEVITTIMLNYIAFALSTYLVSPGGPLVSKTQPSATEKVRSSALFPKIWEPTRLHAGVLLAVVLCFGAWWLLYRMPAGYRLRMVGLNAGAAASNGINVRRVMVSAMCTSGALAGCAGAIEVLGLHGRYFDSFSPGYGFDAIAVALLGMMNPIGVAAAALFFGLLRAGSVLLQARAGISKDLITVISGVIVAAVAGRVAFERYVEKRKARR